jgi:hypothetical protein
VSDLALGLQLDGELNAVALQEAVDEIVERHEILRTGFYGLRNSAIGERYMVLLQNATCSERLTSEQCSMIFNEPWLR